MTKPLTINIDSDDVVYDLSAELLKRANEYWGQDFETFQRWGIGEAYNATDRQVRDFFEQETKKALYALGEPVPWAVYAIRALTEAGHDLRIVTNKHGMGSHKALGMSDMIFWYDDWNLLDLVDAVFARGDKTQYPADVVVDDKPDLTWVQADAVNILFDRPWNQEVTTHAELFRAKGWWDVLEVVEQMGGGILKDKAERWGLALSESAV